MLDKVRQTQPFSFKPGLQPGYWAKTYTTCADALAGMNKTNRCKNQE